MDLAWSRSLGNYRRYIDAGENVTVPRSLEKSSSVIPLFLSLSLRLISLFLSPSYTNNYIRASRNSIHLDRFSQISFHWDATHCHGGGGGRKMILALCQFAARGSINCLVERSRELLRASLVGVPFSTSPRPYRFSFSILCALLPPFRRNYARVDAP